MGKIKIIFKRLHLYLGFVAGVVIFISCLTGTLLVFENELSHFFNKHRYFVSNKNNTVAVSADSLINRFKAENNGVKIIAIKMYAASNKNVELFFTPALPTQKDSLKLGIKTDEKKAPQLIAFIQPYTAQTIEIVDYKKTFFGVIFWLHRALLANKIGQTITGISTLIFLLIISSGVIIWWPKTKANLKQRLLFKKTTNIKLKIYNWHTILGFYSSIFLFFIACTGLTISFKWFNKMVLSFAGGEVTQNVTPSIKKNDNKLFTSASYSTMFANAFGNNSNTQSIKLNFPKQPTDAFTANAVTIKNAHQNQFDVLTFNSTTGAVEKINLYQQKKGAAKLKALLLPIHMGQIGGLGTRLLALLCALLGASFPVTGYFMWWNRTKKKTKVKPD
jgi:uncharacterized iron-regulated membrane protein